MERFGGIDSLVNNAGIAAPSGRPVHEIAKDEWSLMLDIDLSGSWRAMRAVLPAMVAQRSGSVINVASTAGMVGYRYFAAYGADKHGLIGLTRAAALDYAPHGRGIHRALSARAAGSQTPSAVLTSCRATCSGSCAAVVVVRSARECRAATPVTVTRPCPGPRVSGPWARPADVRS